MNNYLCNRRKFLSRMLVAGAGISLLPYAKPAFATNVQGRKLIVVTLNGGCDTANAFPPYQESHYYSIRPTIAIPAEDVIPLNGSDLGMHPALAPLTDIWDAGDMALFPATHCGANPNRSHFYQFDFYSKGAYTTSSSFNDGNGWLGRYLDEYYSGSSNGIASFDLYGGNRIFHGSSVPVFVSGRPDNLTMGGDTALADAVAAQLQAGMSRPRTGVTQNYAKTQNELFDRLSTVNDIDFNVTPSNNASYPDSTFGRKMKHAAILLRNIPELSVLQVDRGGWDTHKDQGGVTGTQATLLADVASGIRALYDDLGSDMSNVTIVVQTEFGRTAHENGSLGTDHGVASAWWVVGGSVNGGQIGTWPGFSDNELDSGRFTAQTTDYRDIFSEVLAWQGFSSPENLFPGYSNTSTYNFMV